jgi:hypothetical protein
MVLLASHWDSRRGNRPHLVGVVEVEVYKEGWRAVEDVDVDGLVMGSGAPRSATTGTD